MSFSKQTPFSSTFPDVKVHGGFYSGYSSLKDQLVQGLKIALQQSGAQTILVTGHSLGGAIAELAAVDLKLNAFPNYNYATYTQGTPRSGNAAFSNLFSQLMNSSFREVHQADVVAHLPPLILNFNHGPMEIWFNEAFSSYRVCNSTMNGEDRSCSNSLLAPVSISDHINYRGVGMGGYCASKKEVLQAAQRPDAVEVDEFETKENSTNQSGEEIEYVDSPYDKISYIGSK